MMRNIPDDILDRAKQMRAANRSWNQIERALGFNAETLRYRIDPDYSRKTRNRIAGPQSTLRASPYRPTEIEVRERLAAVPPDTRSWVARHFGDPSPGRSALDQKRVGGAAPQVPYAPVRAGRTYYLRGFLGQ